MWAPALKDCLTWHTSLSFFNVKRTFHGCVLPVSCLPPSQLFLPAASHNPLWLRVGNPTIVGVCWVFGSCACPEVVGSYLYPVLTTVAVGHPCHVITRQHAAQACLRAAAGGAARACVPRAPLPAVAPVEVPQAVGAAVVCAGQGWLCVLQDPTGGRRERPYAHART